MAAVGVSAPYLNGTIAPSTAEITEEEDFYNHLLAIRDAVLAGEHPQIQLPQSAIEQLKASLIVPDDAVAAAGEQLRPNGVVNASAYTTNQQQSQQASSFSLPGLGGSSANAPNSGSPYGATSGGLDPIFLEKSDSLVRAEGQLKRQRIERELEEQVHQRKHSSREKDSGVEAPSQLDVDSVLNRALQVVKPFSGLKPSQEDASSAIDTDSYYSSKAGDTWLESSPGQASEQATGAFTGDFEVFEQPSCDAPAALSSSKRHKPSNLPRSFVSQPSKDRPHFYTSEPQDATELEVEDEDEEYSPPDATAFDSFRDDVGMDALQTTTQDDDDDDYEPGEITQDDALPTPSRVVQKSAQTSPNVPIIRNHLTHIAAPQPNRVSPLAMAKGPSIELELVNGRPEIVHKPQVQASRPSSGSPGPGGAGHGNKRRRNKGKRKREAEPSAKAQKRRNRQNGLQSPLHHTEQPYIKPEPVSPPPFAAVPDAHSFGHNHSIQYGPAEIDLVSPRPPQPIQYGHEQAPRSGLRYEYAQPSPPVVRLASPAAYSRPIHRDNEDLRRVASLHYAQRPHSPTHLSQRVASPVAPYRAMSVAYPAQEPMHIVTAPTPPQSYEFRPPGHSSRAESPALMAPPPPPQERQIVVINGQRFYAEPAPPAVDHRASVAPPSYRQPEPEPRYEPRAPSRMSSGYIQPLPSQYEGLDSRMGPPPPPRYAEPEITEYLDAQGHRVRAYAGKSETSRYTDGQTSPVYQQTPRYDMAPPLQPSSNLQAMPPAPTSPVYAPPARAYSVRPQYLPEPAYAPRQASVAPVQYVRQEAPRYEQSRTEMPPPPTGYLPRQASVAPVQYARHETVQPPHLPARAVSVVPDGGYGQQHHNPYAYVPQPIPQSVRYVDANGNEVRPQEIRQVSGGQYRY